VNLLGGEMFIIILNMKYKHKYLPNGKLLSHRLLPFARYTRGCLPNHLPLLRWLTTFRRNSQLFPFTDPSCFVYCVSSVFVLAHGLQKKIKQFAQWLVIDQIRSTEIVINKPFMLYGSHNILIKKSKTNKSG